MLYEVITDSAKIADARIEYKSSGQVAEGQVMGWLARFFLSVLPFYVITSYSIHYTKLYEGVGRGRRG